MTSSHLAAIVSAAGFALLLVPRPGPAYRAKPAPGHTGGFDEPSCHKCHFDRPLDAPGGTLALEGVPDSYEAGEAYVLAVRLQREDLRRGGFQLTARFRSGEQAGSFRPLDARVNVHEESGIQYARHGDRGGLPETPGAAEWQVEWTSPLDPEGPVVFHVAANAANDDDSEFGDHIYLDERLAGSAR